MFPFFSGRPPRSKKCFQQNAAASRLSLAILDIEDRKPGDAEKIAVGTAQELETEKLAFDEAAAREVEARAPLAQG